MNDFDYSLQNTTSELNQTDGFLSSILNDEDLQLMDMAMNEGKSVDLGFLLISFSFKSTLQCSFSVICLLSSFK